MSLTKQGLALRKSTLLAQARLAARRSEQLMGSGDQTYQLGVLLAAEAVRHTCASSAIDPAVPINAGPNYYPNDGCAEPGEIDGGVSSSAVSALANVGGRFVTGRLAGADVYTTGDGVTLPYPIEWSADGQHLATYSTVPSNPREVVQVWNADGSPIATATSATGMTSEAALSADGTTLALTSSEPSGGSAVSTWSLQTAADPAAGAGHRPALSANGSVIAWLAPSHAKAIEVKVGESPPRAIALPYTPVEVAVSTNGSLVAALVATGPDAYALVPIDVNNGPRDAPALGSFAVNSANLWSNPPRVSPDATVDPPALWFVPGRPRVWVYNNVRHVGVELGRPTVGPTARIIDRLNVPASIGIGDLSDLLTSTPSGRVAVLINLTATPPTYQVWTLSGTGWTTTGAAPLQLCISQTSCNLSISPNGTDLAVSSLSALQLIHLTSPAGSSSGIVPNPIGAPARSALVMSPSGRTAVSWTAGGAVLVDSASRSVRRLPIPLAPGERFDALGSSPAAVPTSRPSGRARVVRAESSFSTPRRARSSVAPRSARQRSRSPTRGPSASRSTTAEASWR